MNQATEQTVLITGATGGIGLHSALAIARTNARLLITGRNLERGKQAQKRIIEETGNDKVTLLLGDLSSIAGIDALAEEVLQRVDQLDVLINNAGYLGNERKDSDDGFEMHFAVNVLAPWRLSHALLPALRQSSAPRILNVTGGDKPSAVDADNLQAEKGFKGLMTYTHSKSCMEAMSIALSRLMNPEGVMVNIVFPGRASTAMTRSLSARGLPGPMKLMFPFFRLFFAEDGGKSAEKAAMSTIWAATTPDLSGVTGRYFDTNAKEQRLHKTAYEPAVQAKIVKALEGVVPPIKT